MMVVVVVVVAVVGVDLVHWVIGGSIITVIVSPSQIRQALSYCGQQDGFVCAILRAT